MRKHWATQPKSKKSELKKITQPKNAPYRQENAVQCGYKNCHANALEANRYCIKHRIAEFHKSQIRSHRHEIKED